MTERPAGADLRRQALPFGLALTASLILHAAFFSSLPGAAPRRRTAVRDVVVVELQPPTPAPPVAAPAPAVPEPPAPAVAPQSQSKPPPSPQPAPAEAPPVPPVPHALPAPPSQRAPAATARALPAPAAIQASPEPLPAPGAPPVLRAPAPPQLVRPRSPLLRDLLPKAGELASYGQARGLPDPTAPGAREAVVGLGEQDPRYRGYLEQVRASIYGAWRTGRALLVAGPSRTCLVRFWLDPLGLPGDVEVVRRSGNPTLDADAVDAVRRARIPPFPTQWTIERLQMEAQFDYVLP